MRKRKASIALGMSMEVTFLLAVSSIVVARSTFPDVSSDYWAEPSIRELAQRDIAIGYPDGTFKPKQQISRDEWAALLRQAFSQKQAETLPSGNIFSDVKADYWAASAIEEVSEIGFMRAKKNDSFMPKGTVSQLEALVNLTKGLNLQYESLSARHDRPQAPEKYLLFRFPLTALIQQHFVLEKKAIADSPSQTSESALDYIRSRYRDADKIPQSAIDNVAAAIQHDLVVDTNRDEPQLLDPDRPLERGEAAASIYRALKDSGRL